jgi:hypothetical protein
MASRNSRLFERPAGEHLPVALRSGDHVDVPRLDPLASSLLSFGQVLEVLDNPFRWSDRRMFTFYFKLKNHNGKPFGYTEVRNMALYVTVSPVVEV